MRGRLRCFCFGVWAATLVSACGPDQKGTAGQSGLDISADDSEASILVDPSYPDVEAIATVTIAVGLPNAPLTDTDAVTLETLELHAAGTTVSLGGRFEDANVDRSASYLLKTVYDLALTNDAASVACGATDATIHAVVSSAAHGSASADLPVTVTCRPDRRAGELATRALGPNPADKPCEIDGADTVTRLGWDAAGRLEIEDTSVAGGPPGRSIAIRDSAGRVTDSYGIDDGLFTSHTAFTYDGDRVSTSTYDDYESPAETTTLVWTSDAAASYGSVSYTLSQDGLTVTDQSSERTITTTYQDPITLTAYLTQPEHENAAAFRETSATITSRGQVVGALQVDYSDGRIVSETLTSSISSPVTQTWLYTCSF